MGAGYRRPVISSRWRPEDGKPIHRGRCESGCDLANDGRSAAPLGDSSSHGRGFHPGQQHVGAPDLIGGQILAVGLQHIAAIQFFSDRFLVDVLLPGEAVPLGVILDPVVAGYSRVALLEPTHRLVDAARPATPTDGDAAWLLSVLRITSLQTATGRCKARGRSAVDSGAAPTQPASPAVLVLSPALFVVRTSVCGDPSRNCLKVYRSECDLGSPVQEICTPGSKWGDEHKGSCRLGQATVSKEAALARLRKGYRSKACPYPPR